MSTARTRPSCCTRIAAYERAFKLLDETLAETADRGSSASSPTLADINLMPYAARLDYLGLIGAWLDIARACATWWARRRTGRISRPACAI